MVRPSTIDSIDPMLTELTAVHSEKAHLVVATIGGQKVSQLQVFILPEYPEESLIVNKADNELTMGDILRGSFFRV